MKTSRILYCFALIITAISCNSYISKTVTSLNNPDRLKNLKDSIETDKQIKIANKKYNISYEKALELILAVKEIKDVKDEVYKDDTTIGNEILLNNIPNDSILKWGFEFRQFQPRLGVTHFLMLVWVNCSNGEIEIQEFGQDFDKKYTLQEWLTEINKRR